jgi:hypothetical protein
LEKIMDNQELSSSDERILKKKTFLVSDLTRGILRKKRTILAEFSGFLGYRRQFRDGGDGEADRTAGPRRCGIPVVVADRGAGAARVGDGPYAGGAGGIRGTRAGVREGDGDG